MWKKVLVVVAVVGAAAYVVKRVRAANEDRALWHEATTAPDLR
ncbi:DLW-39 family protein [Dactylosporangium sp. AC04546]|nr:DLW-39 family protein [Dactylosporangium sp. AC04546]WVK83892.1 DLW-39 family protein [Dactylosporangium sp. AC04546]